MIRHFKTVHEKKKMFECNICDKCFSSKYRLSTHTESVHSDKTFECSFCKKLYSGKDSLHQHLLRIHEGKKQKCNICGLGLSYNGFSKHLKNVHGGRKTFKCELCLNSFSKKANMIRHVITVHEKKKLFNCSICGKCYGSNGELSRHTKSVHLE